MKVSEGRFQCPCCDYFTLHGRGAYDVCPVCYWEDDGTDLNALDEVSGSNHITLRTARRNFESIGAADDSSVPLVAGAAERDGLRREQRATFH
ncbi:MAG: CPCC family cysteine-rich protein [Planctomycetota bacterium]